MYHDAVPNLDGVSCCFAGFGVTGATMQVLDGVCPLLLMLMMAVFDAGFQRQAAVAVSMGFGLNLGHLWRAAAPIAADLDAQAL